VIRRDADGDHALLDELPVVDAGVVPTATRSTWLSSVVISSTTSVARERTELRSKHRPRRKRRYDEAHTSRRLSVSVAFEEVDANDWREKVYEPDIVCKADTLYKKQGYTM
jgi:hypothetical protein